MSTSHPPCCALDSRLWERRPEDTDFGVIRLGLGTLASTVVYQLADADPLTDDPQLRAAMKLADDSLYVTDIPVILALRTPPPEPKTEGEPGLREEEVTAKEVQLQRTPATHALGIAGERSAVYSYVRTLVAHYAVLHAPSDAKLYVLAQGQREWEWVTQLPHSQGGEQDQLYCFLDAAAGEEESVPSFDEEDEGPMVRFLESLRRTLAQRKLLLEERDDNSASDPGAAAQPLLLLIVDMMDAAAADSPLREIEADPALSILFDAGATLGASVIFLTPDRRHIPARCEAVVEIEKTAPAANRKVQQSPVLHYRYAETGVNSWRYLGDADRVEDPRQMSDLAHKLANCHIRLSAGAELASSVPFLRLMGYASLPAMIPAVARRWQDSKQPHSANWLRARIGLLAGNKPRTLVFSAKRDGVHGMVAGSTGSGKSELLISLVMSMAAQYDPSVVNFVLVDYKGGTAFDSFRDLPHCVNIVTNLNAGGVTRMFTAINSEMRRRQTLNNATGTANIVEYRKNGFHIAWKNGQPGVPYPYLFIIIDEFAEMIADRSEFRAELETITRLGRAQGVSLILAAQRPSGVTDQMRSNIKFRICLRVETPGESRELLRRPDAAFLPNSLPGRGYLQVGNDEVELIQVAYAGDPYVDPAPVLWPDRRAGGLLVPYTETPEMYKVLVGLLNKLARENDVPKQRAPWPDFLPASISLTEVLVSQQDEANAITSWVYLAEPDKITQEQPLPATLTLNPSVNKWLNGEEGWNETPDWQNYALRPIVGLIDDPYGARQLPLTVDLPRGHVVLTGASGWGKTTWVRTLVVSLAASHLPDHAHIYLIDLGGRNLSMLDRLPHVGAVISPEDEGFDERVAQLFRDIDEIVDKRKALLGHEGLLTIYDYNQQHPSDAQPALVVVIDNFVEFRERFDTGNDEIEDIFDKFTDLARQGKAYGIHLVITSNTSGVIPMQIFNLFSERFTLKLSDPTEYRLLVRGAMGDLPEIPGRGFVEVDSMPLTFQVAQPFDLRQEGGDAGATEAGELAIFAANMHAYMDAMRRQGHVFNEPRHIDPLPKALLFKHLLARVWELTINDTLVDQVRSGMRRQWAASEDPEQSDWLRAALGVVSGNRPRIMQFEAKKDGVHGLIAGGTGSGKSELLMTLIVGLAVNYDPKALNFVLVDYKGGGAFKPFEGLPHVVDTITNLNKSGVKRMFTAINAEMQRRQKLNSDTLTKDIVEYRQKGFHLRWPNGQPGIPYPSLFLIIDEYAEMISNNPEFKSELDSIARVGRAQGVHLLLAAQRPTGVTDQMRANIKYRICLRVEEIDTSREMLRRPDAAYLPNGMPGRGYLQVGNDNVELIQVAYTGESYTAPPYDEIRDGERQAKFYDVIVDLARELLHEEQPRTPWPPPLPVRQFLNDPIAVRYWSEEDRQRVLLGRPLALNSWQPALQEWLAGRAAWLGVDWSTNAMRGVAGLVDDPYNARQLPLLVDFSKGHAVLFGASGWGKTTFFRSLVASLAATHSPGEFQAHVLDLGGRSLEVLGAMPHVGSVIMPDERGYEERVQQLLSELENIVDERKRQFSAVGVSTLFEYNVQAEVPVEPAILVLIDNFGEYIETFGSRGGQDDGNSLLGRLVALARQAKTYGIHFIISINRLNALPTPIYSLFTERYMLRLSDTDDYRSIVGAGVPEIDEVAGRGYVRIGRQPLEFQVALTSTREQDGKVILTEAQAIRKVAQQMHTYASANGTWKAPFRIEALPTSSSYRDVLNKEWQLAPSQGFMAGLKSAVRRCWQEAATAEQADWLKFVLGITSGEHRRALHLSAKTDGVHGLIAGGTGSGKSELLMTMIVGLALNHSPAILNFVLVDYKGGGAFRPFERLPHVVDIVTDLNKAAVARMFTSINAEIRRRQRLNADTGTKDIIDYRQKGYHLRFPDGRSGIAYPHLFIIIDEYAEMIDDNPEYKSELESITRVGRAQGINLVLASQRPKGVTDQMRANIKLRICLRVEDLDTSREMLRRPDAAFLPNGVPGRGYLQVGNENIELIQVSYTGEKQPDDREAPVLWPDRPGAAAGSTLEETPRLFDAAVQLAVELNLGQPVPRPWPGFLPEHFSLQTRLRNAKDADSLVLSPEVSDWLNGETERLWTGVDWRNAPLRAVAGIIDYPSEARQDPLSFDLARNHLIIYGDAGSGKTNLLRTLIVSLAATHSPDELHVYVLDLGGRNFRSLEKLPHLGTIIYADEETYHERLGRLVDKLNRVAEERQKFLADTGANTLYDYNSAHPQQPYPALLVVIDNFAALWENHESLVDTSLAPLIRRSQAVGISFVVATSGAVVSKVTSLFGDRITLRQSNTDRYIDLVGRGAIEFGNVPGRGYLRFDQRPLLFQAARPAGILEANVAGDSFAEAADLQRMAEIMRLQSAERMTLRTQPDPIRTLPEIVPLAGLLPALQETPANSIQAVLGENANLQPALVDLKKFGPHFAIAGPPFSGKTTVLVNWIFTLAHRYRPSQVAMLLIDVQRRLAEYGGQHRLHDLPHVLDVLDEVAQLDALLPALKLESEQLPGSGRALYIFIDNYDDFSDELEKNRPLAQEMAFLARRFGRDGLHFVIAGSLDGSGNELRRRIQSANYGLGLRTGSALDTLRVSRRPAGMQDKELNVGRGYLVKSGQAGLAPGCQPL